MLQYSLANVPSRSECALRFTLSLADIGLKHFVALSGRPFEAARSVASGMASWGRGIGLVQGVGIAGFASRALAGWASSSAVALLRKLGRSQFFRCCALPQKRDWNPRVSAWSMVSWKGAQL